MSTALSAYLDQIGRALDAAVGDMELLETHTSSTDDDDDDGKNKYPIRPIVEFPHLGHVEKIRFKRSSKEYCLLETSKNSVRLSLAFKQQFSDAIDQAILEKYVRFFQQRAPEYRILRRKVIDTSDTGSRRGVVQEAMMNQNDACTTAARDNDSYSISFLVTNEHIEDYGRDQVVRTILNFVRQVDRECSDIKISINARARFVATEFLKGF